VSGCKAVQFHRSRGPAAHVRARAVVGGRACLSAGSRTWAGVPFSSGHWWATIGLHRPTHAGEGFLVPAGGLGLWPFMRGPAVQNHFIRRRPPTCHAPALLSYLLAYVSGGGPRAWGGGPYRRVLVGSGPCIGAPAEGRERQRQGGGPTALGITGLVFVRVPRRAQLWEFGPRTIVHWLSRGKT